MTSGIGGILRSHGDGSGCAVARIAADERRSDRSGKGEDSLFPLFALKDGIFFSKKRGRGFDKLRNNAILNLMRRKKRR